MIRTEINVTTGEIFQTEMTAEEIAAFQPSLASAQSTQASAIDLAYSAAVAADISFTTAAGVTAMFQADADSQQTIIAATQGYGLAGSVPTGFFWKAADNSEIPFTLADLRGLYLAILAQGWDAFQKKSSLKTAISAAATVAAVQAITW